MLTKILISKAMYSMQKDKDHLAIFKHQCSKFDRDFCQVS